jgi:hypothetical protein
MSSPGFPAEAEAGPKSAGLTEVCLHGYNSKSNLGIPLPKALRSDLR